MSGLCPSLRITLLQTFFPNHLLFAQVLTQIRKFGIDTPYKFALTPTRCLNPNALPNTFGNYLTQN